MKRLSRLCALICVLLCARAAHAQATAITIAPHDVAIVTVDGAPGLSGRYPIEADGSLTLPLIGRVDAGGLTAEALADVLARRLDVFVKGPLVRVSIERPERVFIFGEVKKPGMYDLTAGMTVVELLVLAEYSGVSEVLIVRTKGARVPVLPEQTSPSDVIRVNLRTLEKDLDTGDLSRNLRLESGDTVFVPKVDPNTVHVTGEVRTPGSYSVPDGTTVRQALVLAGGVTEYGSLRRLRVLRVVNDEQKRYSMDLDGPIQPGDSIVVPEAFSFSYPTSPLSIGESQGSQGFSFASPALPLGTDESSRRPRGTIRLGSVLTLTPSLALTRFGIDTNVFNSAGDRKVDFVAELTPQLQAAVGFPRVQFNWSGALVFAYFHKYKGERGASPSHSASATLAISRRMTLAVGHSIQTPKDRYTPELDARVRRHERQLGVGVKLGPWRRFHAELSGSDWEVTLPGDVTFLGVQLRPTLSERIRTVGTTAHVAVTPVSSLFVSAEAATHRFPLFPSRDADSVGLNLGTSFKRRAFVEGQAQVGLLRYAPLNSTARESTIVNAAGLLSHTWRERAQFGVRGERSIGSTFRPEFPYAVVGGYGGWMELVLPRWFDVVGEAYHDRFNYRRFGAVGGADRLHPARERTVRYTSQLGVRIRGGTRVALEVSYLQRLGDRALDGWTRDYTAWRTNIVYDVSYRFFRIQRAKGSSIRGRNGITNY